MATTVGDFVIQRIKDWGVTRVFAYPGDGIGELDGALGRAERKGEGVDYIRPTHEEICALMATAHAKFTGEVGVCIATSSPGGFHLLNGLYDAQMDNQPVVAIVGQQGLDALGTFTQQESNRQRVFQDVEKELRRDRSPSKALQVSDFGLVIVTRKRVKQSLERQLTEPCPYCSGSGSIRSSATICFEILTELKKIGPELDGQGVLLRVNPDIARALKEEESAVMRELQQVLGRPVTIRPDAHLHHEQFDVMAL